MTDQSRTHADPAEVVRHALISVQEKYGDEPWEGRPYMALEQLIQERDELRAAIASAVEQFMAGNPDEAYAALRVVQGRGALSPKEDR